MKDEGISLADQKSDTIGLVLFALFISIISAYFTISTHIPDASSAIQARQILANGVSVSGVVKDSDVEYMRYRGGHKESRVTLVAEFKVDNKEIYSATGIKTLNDKYTRDAIEEFYEGEQVTIYYDPSDPSQNFIERTESTLWGPVLAASFLGLISLIGFGIVGRLIFTAIKLKTDEE